MIFRRKKDPDERAIYGMHVGDWGVIVIAAILTMGAVYLFLSPTDYGAYFIKAQKALSNSAPPQQQQQSRPGETQMMLFDARKK
jgi:hypothetical protein